jgi:hypothetical protein
VPTKRHMGRFIGTTPGDTTMTAEPVAVQMTGRRGRVLRTYRLGDRMREDDAWAVNDPGLPGGSKRWRQLMAKLINRAQRCPRCLEWYAHRTPRPARAGRPMRSGWQRALVCTPCKAKTAARRRARTNANTARTAQRAEARAGRHCATCGAALESQRSTRRFCKVACRVAHWRNDNGRPPSAPPPAVAVTGTPP